MKKIIKLFILGFACLLPVMVEAKVNYEFDWDLYNRVFWYKDNDEYKFLEFFDWDFFTDYVWVYDENGNFIDGITFSEELNDNGTLKNSKAFEAYKYLSSYYDGELYDEETDMFYYVDYYSGIIDYYDSAQEKYIQIDFEDDLSFTKRLLGKRYDIYLNPDNGYRVSYIDSFNNYYILYQYETSSYKGLIKVLDENLDSILSFEFDDSDFYPTVYVFDDLIYVAVDNKTINIYTNDGKKYDSIKVVHDEIFDIYSGSCGKFELNNLFIYGNELFILYTKDYCPERVRMNNVNDALKDNTKVEESKDSIILKYTLEYEVNAVSSSDGEFTYETKVDDDGRSYVELKVVPKDGYSVEEIIVTDANGERIEVTNNKFYRPLNDVKVEVKYVKGEYLPIPDTFLGKSVSLIIIGLILVGLGSYTINYVKNY
ncbi:MAG: hypothetical protein IJ463_02430 [Bacilli bacterium]|nr:hypothetical protein [Bacilli bacterium]